jgi:hypothetical protein
MATRNWRCPISLKDEFLYKKIQKIILIGQALVGIIFLGF